MTEIAADLAAELKEGDVVLTQAAIGVFPAYERVVLSLCPHRQLLGLLDHRSPDLFVPLDDLKDDSGGLPSLTLVRQVPHVYFHGGPKVSSAGSQR